MAQIDLELTGSIGAVGRSKLILVLAGLAQMGWNRTVPRLLRRLPFPPSLTAEGRCRTDSTESEARSGFTLSRKPRTFDVPRSFLSATSVIISLTLAL